MTLSAGAHSTSNHPSELVMVLRPAAVLTLADGNGLPVAASTTRASHAAPLHARACHAANTTATALAAECLVKIAIV